MMTDSNTGVGLPNRPRYDGHVHVFPRPLQDRIYEWFHRAGWSIRYQGLYEEAVW